MTAILITPEQHAQIVEALEENHYSSCTTVAEEKYEAAITLLRSLELMEPIYHEYQWTNPGNQPDQPNSMFEWARVVPTWNQTELNKVYELLAYRYNNVPVYRVRPVYAAKETP